MKKIAWLLVFVSQMVLANTPSEIVQSKLNALKTMSANFTQVVNAKHREISHSSGLMALSRPGRFRWETKNPMEQVVVADGNRLWIFDKDLEQVSVKKQEKSIGGMVGLFLSGYNDTVARDFDVVMKSNGSKETFDMKAKSTKSSFQRVKLVFDGAALCGIVLYDQLGQCTDVSLTQIHVNPKLAASMFQFKVPRGVDVVEQ